MTRHTDDPKTTFKTTFPMTPDSLIQLSMSIST